MLSSHVLLRRLLAAADKTRLTKLPKTSSSTSTIAPPDEEEEEEEEAEETTKASMLSSTTNSTITAKDFINKEDVQKAIKNISTKVGSKIPL